MECYYNSQVRKRDHHIQCIPTNLISLPYLMDPDLSSPHTTNSTSNAESVREIHMKEGEDSQAPQVQSFLIE